jgi:cell division protease FtsH
MQKRNLPGCSALNVLIWLAVAVAFIWPVVWNRSDLFGIQDRAQISYTAFRAELEDGNIELVTVKGQEIAGQLKEPAQKETEGEDTVEYVEFITYLPSFGDEELLSLLEVHKVEVETQPQVDFSWWSVILNGCVSGIVSTNVPRTLCVEA